MSDVKIKVRKSSTTSLDIMSIAEQFIIERGFNGFSFQDIASQLNISKTAIYHYFDTKEDLVRCAIDAYTKEFSEKICDIYNCTDIFKERIEKYVEIYQAQVKCNKVCLCGFLAMESNVLAEHSRQKLSFFFELNMDWLKKIYIEQYPIESVSRAKNFSASLFGVLQGALVVSRVSKEELNLMELANVIRH
jgi:TetR/AcrR family transcriptional repressor of nem operon